MMKNYHETAVMEVDGLVASVNTPAALKGEDLNALPPHSPVAAHVVDEYPACPKTWMHGSSKASSYFIGVEPGKGMWFDFTRNQHHKHDIAVVVSVQGINPVTGQKTAALNLEQYRDKCPVHNVEFQQDRFCPECGYKWPAQNYISSTTGQPMWIDGFRNEKGEVRQYIITEEECSGVASQLIGEERVFAIGFAFYRSKKPKPVVERSVIRAQSCAMKGPGGSSVCGFGFNAAPAGPPSADHLYSCCSIESLDAFEDDGDARGLDMEEVSEEAENAKLEIGAGARIEQDHGIDPNYVDFWEDEPVGLIYVNYVPVKVAQKILAAGKREEKKDGYLAGLKVGK